MRKEKRILGPLCVLLISMIVFTLIIEGKILTFRGEDESAHFSPPHSHYFLDEDMDGKHDVFTLNVSVEVLDSSTFSLFGVLYYSCFGGDGNGDQNKSWVHYFPGPVDEVNLDLSVGNYTIQFNFSTIMIERSSRNGVWYVDLSLYDVNSAELQDTDKYTTNSLDYTDFDPPPAVLYPPFTDYGIDNNTNNIYDWLVVNVTLGINENGSYRVTGSLFSGNWSTTIDIVNYIDDFTVGNLTIKLWFNVTDFSDEEGPYEVVIKICGTSQTYDETIYTTSTESFKY